MIGASLSQYRITASIGAGGMGEVFRARDTRLNRDVAVKVLPRDFASDANLMRRFEQEAKTLAALNHPNILTIHDAGIHEGSPYLVSELLEGKTLREEMNGGALPIRKTREYALQIAHGLAAAHGKGVVHRDLKPENIFVTKDGRVKILDFGLAKLRAKPESEIRNPNSTDAATVRIDADGIIDTTEPGLVFGTPAYMSPEQVRGEPADHRTDIFAFGCVLYEMLSGTRAFRRNTARISIFRGRRIDWRYHGSTRHRACYGHPNGVFCRSLEDRAVHRGVGNHGDHRRLATVEKGSDIFARESTAARKAHCDRYGASAPGSCPRSLRQRLGRLTRRDEVGHRALSECD